MDTVLVPLELPDPVALSPTLVADLASLRVVLLGHYTLPEQTPAAAATEQFGDEARATLEAVAADFEAAGAEVETRLVFGKDHADAVEQVMTETDCVAELLPAPTERIERVLVPLPDVAEFARLPRFVRLLAEDTTHTVTLFHVVEGDEDRARGEAVVAETREGMIEAGFDPATLDTRVVEGEDHDDEILRVAPEYDAVVMYEAQSRLGDRIFGTLPRRIADETDDPVIVVRRDYDPA